MCDDYGDYDDWEWKNEESSDESYDDGFNAGYEAAKKDLVDSLSTKKWCSSHNNDSVRAFGFFVILPNVSLWQGFWLLKNTNRKPYFLFLWLLLQKLKVSLNQSEIRI